MVRVRDDVRQRYRRLVNWVKGSSEPDTEAVLDDGVESDPALSDVDTRSVVQKVVGLDLSVDELKDVIAELAGERTRLRREIRAKIRSYQRKAGAVEESVGVNEADKRVEAQSLLDDANVLKKQYDEVAAYWQQLKRGLHQVRRRLRQKRREVKLGFSFDDIDLESVDQGMEEFWDEDRRREEKLTGLKQSLDSMGPDVEPDTSDVDRDVGELEEELGDLQSRLSDLGAAGSGSSREEVVEGQQGNGSGENREGVSKEDLEEVL